MVYPNNRENNLKRKISGKEPIDEKIFLERFVIKSKIEDNSTEDDDYNSEESEKKVILVHLQKTKKLKKYLKKKKSIKI